MKTFGGPGYEDGLYVRVLLDKDRELGEEVSSYAAYAWNFS